MGFAIPAAVAASLAGPGRPVVALAGDGGAAMTIAELETAIREGLHPVVLVFDNEQYGTIHDHQVRRGLAPVGTDLGPVDWARVAEGFGALGSRVDRDGEFEAALRTALSATLPTVLHLVMDRRWASVDRVGDVAACGPPAEPAEPELGLEPEARAGARGRRAGGSRARAEATILAAETADELPGTDLSGAPTIGPRPGRRRPTLTTSSTAGARAGVRAGAGSSLPEDRGRRRAGAGRGGGSGAGPRSRFRDASGVVIHRDAAEIGAGLEPARPARPIPSGERIHVIGAGGAAAAAACLLAHDVGARASGCDAGGPSPYTPPLEDAGIHLSWTHAPEHVAQAGSRNRGPHRGHEGAHVGPPRPSRAPRGAVRGDSRHERPAADRGRGGDARRIPDRCGRHAWEVHDHRLASPPAGARRARPVGVRGCPAPGRAGRGPAPIDRPPRRGSPLRRRGRRVRGQLRRLPSGDRGPHQRRLGPPGRVSRTGRPSSQRSSRGSAASTGERTRRCWSPTRAIPASARCSTAFVTGAAASSSCASSTPAMIRRRRRPPSRPRLPRRAVRRPASPGAGT